MNEYRKVTEVQQKVWSLGDLGKLAARNSALAGELLCEELDLRASERVLDVAAGTGPTAIAAARRFCDVTAVDFVPELLVQATRLAECEGLKLTVHPADAQELPFEDDQFDVALSTFGVMFAPDQQRAADELLRVVRPGGRIGLAAWCPDGTIGTYAGTIGTYLPPPPGLRSPFEWGTQQRIRELFGERVTSVRYTRRSQPFRYPSAEFAVEYFRTWYGPAHAAFAKLDTTTRDSLYGDMTAVWNDGNRAGDGSLVAFADYLETVAVVAPTQGL